MLALRIEKHADGLWHGRHETAEDTLCGRPREPQKQGRPARKPSCTVCLGRLDLPAPKKNPAVRADGKCVVCLKARKPERSRRYAGIEAQLDPFCSTKCCKVYFGIADRFEDSPEADGRASDPDPRLEELAA